MAKHTTLFLVYGVCIRFAIRGEKLLCSKKAGPYQLSAFEA